MENDSDWNRIPSTAATVVVAAIAIAAIAIAAACAVNASGVATGDTAVVAVAVMEAVTAKPDGADAQKTAVAWSYCVGRCPAVAWMVRAAIWVRIVAAAALAASIVC